VLNVKNGKIFRWRPLARITDTRQQQEGSWKRKIDLRNEKRAGHYLSSDEMGLPNR
jgi:hypothetical protein